MNIKTKELCEMIKNANPFNDEFWSEVLSEQVDEFVSNFSKKDWIDVVSALPLGNKEKDYCLLEVIFGNCTNEIVSLTIEKMIDLICQYDYFLDLVFLEDRVSQLNLSEDVIAKLKNACKERIRTIQANMRTLDSKLKQFEIFMKKQEKTHYCPILDKQIDEANCLEVRAIVDGEMIDVGGTGDGDYSKIYDLKNYDETCKFDCRELNLPLEKRRKCFFNNKEDYMKRKK